jgi:hypothetical protein
MFSSYSSLSIDVSDCARGGLEAYLKHSIVVGYCLLGNMRRWMVWYGLRVQEVIVNDMSISEVPLLRRQHTSALDEQRYSPTVHGSQGRTLSFFLPLI